MQDATGQKVTGLLNAGEMYSQFWNKRNVTKVDTMRSPLTHFSEHYPVELKNTEEMKKWYKYSYSGVIVNCHDAHTMHWAGSDKFEYLKDYCELVYLDRTEGISTSKIKNDLGLKEPINGQNQLPEN